MEISTRRFSFRFRFNISLPIVSLGLLEVRRTLGHAHKVSAADKSSTDLVLEPQMTRRRTAALKELFPYLFSCLANRSQLAPMHQANDYLFRASNLEELEQRIRNLEQRNAAGSFASFCDTPPPHTTPRSGPWSIGTLLRSGWEV
jgi:hypothetical protein